MKLKSIYLNRAKTLKTLIKKTEDYILVRKKLIDECIVLMEEKQAEMSIIRDDEKMEGNIKYILLNEKVSDIGKIMAQINSFYEEVFQKNTQLTKEKSILLESCKDEHSEYTESQIVNFLEEIIYEK